MSKSRTNYEILEGFYAEETAKGNKVSYTQGNGPTRQRLGSGYECYPQTVLKSWETSGGNVKLATMKGVVHNDQYEAEGFKGDIEDFLDRESRGTNDVERYLRS